MWLKMDTKYFSIVGYSGSGKTYLIKNIIKYLTKKGYKVCVIKSMHHPGFGIDIKGKDTAIYGEAGATLISYIAPESSGIIYRAENVRSKIFKIVEKEVDFVILEGIKDMNFIPQIALINEIDDLDIFINNNTVGVYSHKIDLKDHELYIEFEKIPGIVEKLAYPHIPLLNCQKCGYKSCAEFYNHFLKGDVKLEKCVARDVNDVFLYVNEKNIALNRFAANLLKNILVGCIETLKLPAKSISDIQLEIKF